MAGKNIFTVPSFIILLFLISACSDAEDKRQETVFKKLPEIAEIKPGNPVKIKLKRNGDGGYSWELNGDDAEKVLQADRKLKESLENKK